MDSSAYVERLQVDQLVLDINASVRAVFGSTSVCVCVCIRTFGLCYGYTVIELGHGRLFMNVE